MPDGSDSNIAYSMLERLLGGKGESEHQVENLT